MSSKPFTFSSTTSHPGKYSSRSGGFALIIALSLMAFVLLLLISIVSFSHVETMNSANSKAQTEARQNALLALNIAVGQLQKYAGPDQRVTGSADLAGDANGLRLDNGSAPDNTQSASAPTNGLSNDNGLTAVQAGTRYWTGVWGNADPSDPTIAGNIYEKTPSPKLLGWLVSGNENTTFTTSTATTNFGQVTAEGSNIDVTPSETTTGISATMSATDAVKIGNHDAVILLGPGSEGTNTKTLPDGTTEAATDRYVAAPLVPINGVNRETGNYAYWVGDEGVKARINLIDPNADATDASSDEAARYRQMTAPRSGVEAIADFESSNYLDWSQSTTSSPFFSWSQTRFIDPSNITETILRNHNHDLTSYSTGLVVDSYNGGLRRDLTHALSTSTLPTDLIEAGIIPDAYSPRLPAPTEDDPEMLVPQWALLHSFYQLAEDAEDGSVEIRPQTETQMGIFPMISMARLMTGYVYNPDPEYGISRGHYFASPVIMLSNPYNVTLTCSTDLELEYVSNGKIENYPGDSPILSWRETVTLARKDWARFSDTGTHGLNKDLLVMIPPADGGGGMFNNCPLVISEFSLAPGESKLYRIDGRIERSAWGLSEEAEKKLPMVETNPGELATEYNYVYQVDWADSNGNNPLQYGLFFMADRSGSYPSLALEMSRVVDDTLGLQMPTLSGDIDNDIVKLQTVGEFIWDLEGLGGRDNEGVIGGAVYGAPPPYTEESPAPFVAINFAVSWIYNFPGNYDTNITSGLHNNLRSYADFNPRASYFGMALTSGFAAPYQQQWSSPNENADAEVSSAPSSMTAALTPNNAWAYSIHNDPVNSGVLFSLPNSSDLQKAPPLFSMAQLQHANISAMDGFLDVGSRWDQNVYQYNVGYQPGYAIANSYSSAFVSQDLSSENRTRYPKWDMPPSSRRFYDISYLLNAALWDQYFFSTILQDGSSPTPANPRIKNLTADTSKLVDGKLAAAHTSINGAFNINSTSIDAWTAVLSGMRALPDLPASSSDNTSSTIFPRSIWQPGASQEVLDYDNQASYNGYRALTDEQIRNLATAIVKEIRLRGPFVSLAQFVNRALAQAPLTEEGEPDPNVPNIGQSGALQRAIDSGTSINDFAEATVDIASFPPGSPLPADPETFTGQRSSAIPGWLTQADVLQGIGPILSARSDTFTIRTYGETTNPIGATTGRAWCEAVVQRIPTYVNASIDPATTHPRDLTDTVNKDFGRRFKIVSLRWLSADEI